MWLELEACISPGQRGSRFNGVRFNKQTPAGARVMAMRQRLSTKIASNIFSSTAILKIHGFQTMWACVGDRARHFSKIWSFLAGVARHHHIEQVKYIRGGQEVCASIKDLGATAATKFGQEHKTGANYPILAHLQETA